MNCKGFVEAHPDKGDCFVYALNTPVEKGKKFSIILQKGKKETFLRIKIDKGLLAEIDSETIKCDYGFIRDQNSDYYFVELKGSDIAHAVEQLIRTITIFKAKYQIQASQTYAYIASSSVPSAANQKFQRLQEEFIKKKIGVELKKQTNHYQRYVY
jgi:hypothetical protein